MAHDDDPGIDGAATLDGGALPDVTMLTAAAVLASGDTVLRHALRRIASEIGDSTPILAAFGNFAPPDPDPH
jgi:FXSXX-COOH protein